MTLATIASITSPYGFDQWGPLQFPTSSGHVFKTLFDGWGKTANESTAAPPSDPCLAACLDFIGSWLITDRNVAEVWDVTKAGATSGRAVRSVWLHDPTDVYFVDTMLPALFLWRESAKQEWVADDYLQETTVVKGAYFFPISMQAPHRVRSLLANVIPKAIAAGIERGRTPSWVQPDDTDPNALTQGSLFYPYAGFDRFWLETCRKGRVNIKGIDESGIGKNYFALELTFTLVEMQTYGLGRYPTLKGADATISIAVPATLTPWTASTFYPARTLATPTPTNNFYYVCTTAGTSGATAPTWSTTPGATTADGMAVWTTLGRVSTVIDSGPLEK